MSGSVSTPVRLEAALKAPIKRRPQLRCACRQSQRVDQGRECPGECANLQLRLQLLQVQLTVERLGDCHYLSKVRVRGQAAANQVAR